MSSLAIQTFGTLQVILGGEPITDFRTRKVQALLTYLAAEPIPHNRDRLLDLLWPGLPERSARSNLRQILYYLRQDIPDDFDNNPDSAPLVIANRQDIQLNPQAAVKVDTGRFEAFLNETRNHNHPDLFICQTCRQNLEQAVELYKGDFLSDFYLDDSTVFEDWAQSRREYYRRRTLDTLSILTTIYTRQKEYPKAQPTAEHQLEIDNLSESAYRQLMEIHALNGRREQALAVYESCRRILAEELGMAPAARSTELYQKVLAGDLDFQTIGQQDVRGYDLKELIAEGSHGAVHRAIQPVIGREVAVKVIQRRHADDPDFIRRFEAEAQMVARLEHPYIVPLYDYWRDPNGAYLVMRYMRHGSLLNALQSGPWEPPRAANLLTQIAAALTAAHQKGIVHRDLKPGNILLDEGGNAYLTDFGIAKELGRMAPITADNAVVGTLDYTSPEQILNGEVTPQSDIYSLGAVIYETLTGEKPFADDSIANLLYNHLNTPMPMVTATRSDIPVAVDTVLQKATAKKAAERYATAQELALAFSRAVGTPELGREPERVGLTMPVPEVGEIYNPYKGLRAFQEADADDFFGRDNLVQQLVDRLGGSDSRFLAIVGPSGSGKSSVVKAGLIPALRGGALPGSEQWFTAEMVPGSHPLEELELALWPVAVNPPPSLVEPMERDTRGLLRTVRRILPDEPGAQLFLVIDQFEELFTLVEDEERRAFFLDSLLAALQAPRSPLRVVVTLRADFYDRPLLHPEWGQLLKDNTEIVLPLNHSELTWAIREPARRMGVRLEEELLSTIVGEVSDQLGALPLLQYALTELFERRKGGLISHQAYKAIGGVQGALGRRAEALYEALDEPGQEAARQLFLRLVTLGEGAEDTRRRVLRSELTSVLHNSQFVIQYSLLETILDNFGRARLLTFDRDPLTREPTVEVAHEALLREWPQLRHWLDQSRGDVRFQRLLAQAAGEWEMAGREPGYLLRGSRLDLFAGWLAVTDLALIPIEHEYLSSSIAARRERQTAEETRRQKELETAQQLAETERRRAQEQTLSVQQLRRRALWLVGALGVAILLAIVAVFFARQSSINAEEARASADLAATREIEAITSAGLAATREVDAITNAELAATREFEAITSAELAATREAEAEAQRILALNEAEQRAIAQAEAELQALLATSRGLAATALSNLAEDPELSILLAMQALSVTYTIEAEEALHQTIQSSHVRQTLAVSGNQYTAWPTYSPDGRHLFTVGSSGWAMWDTVTGGIVYTRTIELINGFKDQALFSPDGSLLVIPRGGPAGNGTAGGMITILEAATGLELLTFAAHDPSVNDVAINPQGTLVASSGEEGVVKIWDLAATLEMGNGQQVATLCCSIHAISVNYNPDGSRLVVGNAEGTVVVWDIDTERELLVVNVVNQEPVVDAVFSPDGQYLIVTGNTGTLFIYEVESGNMRASVHAHGQTILTLAFSPDGSQLITTSGDGNAKIWDFFAGTVGPNPVLISGHTASVLGASFSSDGRYLATGSTDGTTRVWDVSAGGGGEFGAYTHDGRVTDVAISPDGNWAASTSLGGTAKIWDIDTGEVRFTLIHEKGVIEVAIHPDGQTLATTSNDGTARIWDSQTGNQLLVIPAHEVNHNYFSGAKSIAYSPDGSYLATGGADNLARVWDATTGQELFTLGGHTDPIFNVAYSPDGRWLVTAADDGLIKVWAAADGRELWTLTGDASPVYGISFSEDGSRLVAGQGSGQVSVWQFPASANSPDAEPEIILQFQHHPENPGFAGIAHFSYDGTKLIVPGGSQTSLYNALTGELIVSLGHPGISSVFSPDDHLVVLGGDDGMVRLLAANLEELLALARSRVTRSLTEAECQQFLHLETCPNEP